MDDSERPGSCTIEWNPPGLTLDDLAKFTSLVLDLHNDVAVPYVTEVLFGPGSVLALPKAPLVTSIRMGSPLVTQLLGSSTGLFSVGMVGLILKHPDRLGEFLPRVGAGRYRGRTERLDERLRYEERLQYVEDRAPVQTRGRSIERFEERYRSIERSRSGREREQGNQSSRDDQGRTQRERPDDQGRTQRERPDDQGRTQRERPDDQGRTQRERPDDQGRKRDDRNPRRDGRDGRSR